MIRGLVLLAVVAVAFAQLPTPPGPTWYAQNSHLCQVRNGNIAGMTVMDLTTTYTANFTGQKRICAWNYQSACAQTYGVVACNNYNSWCANVGTNVLWNNNIFHPEMVARINQRPQVCITKGGFWAPDSGVVIVATVMSAWLLLTLGFIQVNHALGLEPSRRNIQIIGIFAYITCGILLFSYYYLNGILGFATIYAALALFGFKRVETTCQGYLFIFIALIWVTFQGGLGELQHHSRFGPNFLSSQYQYEQYCDGYYRAWFFLNSATAGDFENPAQTNWGYCHRNWLSAELFAMIFFELLFALATVFPANTLFSLDTKEVKVLSNKPENAAATTASAPAPAPATDATPAPAAQV